MPIDRVVINASPLIVLFKSGQADLLPQLSTTTQRSLGKIDRGCHSSLDRDLGFRCR